MALPGGGADDHGLGRDESNRCQGNQRQEGRVSGFFFVRPLPSHTTFPGSHGRRRNLSRPAHKKQSFPGRPLTNCELTKGHRVPARPCLSFDRGHIYHSVAAISVAPSRPFQRWRWRGSRRWRRRRLAKRRRRRSAPSVGTPRTRPRGAAPLRQAHPKQSTAHTEREQPRRAQGAPPSAFSTQEDPTAPAERAGRAIATGTWRQE